MEFWTEVWRGVNPTLVFDSRFTTYANLSKLNEAGILASPHCGAFTPSAQCTLGCSLSRAPCAAMMIYLLAVQLASSP